MATRLLFITVMGMVLLGYCDSESPRRLPVLPAQFSLNMEIIDFDSKRMYASKEIFDYEAKLARSDIIPPPHSDLWRKFGDRPITLVSDFKTGNRYVIDRWARNCTQSAIPAHSWVAETVPSSQYVQMKHSYDIFDRVKSPAHYVYKGETTVRNISVDEWTKMNDGNDETIYILRRDWKSNSEWTTLSITDIPVALKITKYDNKTGSIVSEQMIHIYDFYSGHPERMSFDIQDCFSFYMKYKSLMFLLKGSYLDNVYGKHEQVYTAVINAISKHAKTSKLRITNVFLSQTIPLFIDVTFMIRTKPKTQSEVPDTGYQPTVDEAFDNLKKSVSSGFSISVPYKEGTKDLEVMKSSLAVRTRWFSVNPKDYDNKSQLTTYTPGSMAGLGIGMILIGFVLGVGGAFFIHKRLNTQVPYKISD